MEDIRSILESPLLLQPEKTKLGRDKSRREEEIKEETYLELGS